MRAFIPISCLFGLAAVACSDAPQGPASNPPPPIAAGRYCAVQEIEGLGQAVAEATVSGAGETIRLAASRSMPDSGQILDVGPEPAQVDSDGKVFVSFEDGWNNRGLATLAPSGALSLQIVTPSPDPAGGNIRRNYGDFILTSRACADIRPAG